MISASEGDIVFLKLGENENLENLENILEAYEINSGFLEGFGKVKYIETENEKFSGEIILFGLISELKGKPNLKLYCYSSHSGRVRNFLSEELTIIVRRFDKIKLSSMIDEEGKERMVIKD